MKKWFSFLLIIATLPLMAAINWSTPPVTISDSGVNATNPVMGIDGSGNIVALWLENGSLVYATLPVNGSWSSPATLASGGNSSSPQIAVDPNGNATALWVQGSAIQTATKPFNENWGSTTTLASSGASMPQIAVDGSGNVVAIWVNNGIYSATQLFGGSWPVSPDTLSTITESNAPQIAIGSNGDVVAIWHSMWPTTSNNTIFVSNKTIGGGWTAASNISNSYQNSVYPQIAVDPTGNATALWYTYNIAGNDAYVNTMLETALMDGSNNLWSDPVKLSSTNACNPANLMAKVQYDSLGNAMAMWTESYNGTNYTIKMTYMQLMNGTLNWTSPQQITWSPYCYGLDFAVTANSDVFAAYMAVDTSSNVSIQTAQSHIGGWTAGYWNNVTELSNTTTNISPQIAAAALSNNTTYTAALWTTSNGANTVIQSSWGSQSNILPPSSPAVTQSSNLFGTFTEYYNTLTWTASPSSNAYSYIIFRNGLAVSSVKNSGTLQYIDHNQVQNGTVVYTVSTSDSTGYNQSSYVSVAFP